MATEIWCLLIDINNMPIGSPFDVATGNIKFISHLMEKVKEKRPKALENVDAADLTLWQCKAIDWPNVARSQLGQIISDIDFSDEAQAILLDEAEEVKDLELVKKEKLLVRTPGMFPHSSLNLK